MPGLSKAAEWAALHVCAHSGLELDEAESDASTKRQCMGFWCSPDARRTCGIGLGLELWR